MAVSTARGDAGLALSLFYEGHDKACYRESQRVLKHSPEHRVANLLKTVIEAYHHEAGSERSRVLKELLAWPLDDEWVELAYSIGLVEEKRHHHESAQVLLALAQQRKRFSGADPRQDVTPDAKAKGSHTTALPGSWIVAAYRKHIRPAIGSRCSLTPSCSEYFRQASKQHGLLGIPLIGDRLVREPSVVTKGKDPVCSSDKIRYRDSLQEHTIWFKNDP